MLLFYEIDELKGKILSFHPYPFDLREYFRTKFIYSSNVLSGNILNESETKSILRKGLHIDIKLSKDITINGKPLKNHFEVLGNNDAFDYMYDLSVKTFFTVKQIIKMHKLLYSRINKKKAGVFRKEPLKIPGSKYKLPSAKDITPLMEKYLRRLDFFRKNLHPVEYAAKLHRELLEICPFDDGNGRIARLMMNLALLQKGYFVCLIPTFRKERYLYSLEKSHIDERIFINFIGNNARETYASLLRLLSYGSNSKK